MYILAPKMDFTLSAPPPIDIVSVEGRVLTFEEGNNYIVLPDGTYSIAMKQLLFYDSSHIMMWLWIEPFFVFTAKETTSIAFRPKEIVDKEYPVVFGSSRN